MSDKDHTPEDDAARPADDAPVVAEAAPAPEAAVPVTAPAAARRGGVVAPLIGGALAAAFGFGLSHLDVFSLRQPAYDDAALTARLSEAEAKVASLDSTIATLRTEAQAAAAQAKASAEALAPLSAGIEAVSSRIDTLDAALAAAAKISPDGTVSPGALAALSAAVDALKAEMAALRATPAGEDALRAIAKQELAAWEAAAAERLKAEAEAAKAKADRAAGFATLQQAIVTGAPYAASLEALGAEVPPVVSDHAETGLPTVVSLAEAFPVPARAALDAALRAEAGDGVTGGLWAFLRIQTGARSLTPQEGDDADAVLSRAEAALQAGDVAAALDELAALPAEAQVAMADWIALAQVHIAAAAAISALAAP